jgi:hypothetical protein
MSEYNYFALFFIVILKFIYTHRLALTFITRGRRIYDPKRGKPRDDKRPQEADTHIKELQQIFEDNNISVSSTASRPTSSLISNESNSNDTKSKGKRKQTEPKPKAAPKKQKVSSNTSNDVSCESKTEIKKIKISTKKSKAKPQVPSPAIAIPEIVPPVASVSVINAPPAVDNDNSLNPPVGLESISVPTVEKNLKGNSVPAIPIAASISASQSTDDFRSLLGLLYDNMSQRRRIEELERNERERKEELERTSFMKTIENMSFFSKLSR